MSQSNTRKVAEHVLNSQTCLQHLEELDNDPILAENIIEYLNEITCNNERVDKSKYIVCFTVGGQEDAKPQTFTLEGLVGYILSQYKFPSSDNPRGKFNKKFKYPMTSDYYFDEDMYIMVLTKVQELQTVDPTFMKEYFEKLFSNINQSIAGNTRVSNITELIEFMKGASNEYGNAEFGIRSAFDNAYFENVQQRRLAALNARTSFQRGEHNNALNSPPSIPYRRQRRSACPSPSSSPMSPSVNNRSMSSFNLNSYRTPSGGAKKNQKKVSKK